MQDKDHVPTGPKQRPLYLNGSEAEDVPITYEQLDYALTEILHAMNGCLDHVRDMEDINDCSDFCSPLLMWRLTLEYGISQLLSVRPCGPIPEASP